MQSAIDDLLDGIPLNQGSLRVELYGAFENSFMQYTFVICVALHVCLYDMLRNSIA